jgi:heat shock protein HslJ
MKTTIFTLSLMLLTGFAACKTGKQAIAGTQPGAVNVMSDTIDIDLCNKYWKLVELNGKPVKYEGIPSEAHISFKTDGMVTGSFSCNTFSGAYSVKKGAANRIRLTGLVSTQKMCINMSIEDELRRVLNMTDSYNLNDGKELILNRARMAPLARFEAVYMN